MPNNEELLITSEHRSSYNKLSNTGTEERLRYDTSNIRYLQLLRAMIHNEIMFINPDARKGQNPATFRKYIASYTV